MNVDPAKHTRLQKEEHTGSVCTGVGSWWRVERDEIPEKVAAKSLKK